MLVRLKTISEFPVLTLPTVKLGPTQKVFIAILPLFLWEPFQETLVFFIGLSYTSLVHKLHKKN